MLTMSQQSTIWELWQNGKNKKEISDVLHIDRKTVTKYLDKKDFSDTLERYEIKEKEAVSQISMMKVIHTVVVLSLIR